ncbi:RNA methyltransferase [Hahella sp. SMD15-11]|uniref:tRNA (cytidine/uridine-2'-O-)-methyltransferase TrmJ n=1 Tax=Thermohahella caldifontis TaxID=3142973 RepID=A0AB39V091_9GAMM
MLENIRVVLMRTTHPGNIGAVARAMKNMCLADLCLVSPERFPHPEAEWRASGATDVLDNAKVVSTLEEAVADRHLVVGASARRRGMPWPVQTPRQFAADVMRLRPDAGVAIVFGQEQSGLSNEELTRCHRHIAIPANPEYAALNLAMAVQVIAYEVYHASLEHRQASVLEPLTGPLDPEWDQPPCSQEEMERFYAHLEEALIDIDFHTRERPRQLMSRLRRLYQRVQPDQNEMAILRGILSHTQKAARGRYAHKFNSEVNDPS